MTIPLSAPDIDEEDIAAVVAVLRSGRLSLGPAVDLFEANFASYLDVQFAVSVSSGTAGLHLALLALDIGPGDEVIVPSFTFIAAANAIRYVGATPVFADIDAVTLNLDPASVEQAISPRTRALMVVHTFGVPAAMEPLLHLARLHGLKVIEDACEAVGAEYRGRRVGTLGDVGVFAFYANKQMTTGEGGMLVTRSQVIAEMARSLRNQGRATGDWFEHARLGFNYRLSELHAALGSSQLRRIDQMLTARSHVASLYTRALRSVPDITLPVSSVQEGRISWFVYVVRLSGRLGRSERDRVLATLAHEGVMCGRYFAPVHRQQAYVGIGLTRSSLPVTDSVAERSLALPFFNLLSGERIQAVVDNLRRALAKVSA